MYLCLYTTGGYGSYFLSIKTQSYNVEVAHLNTYFTSSQLTSLRTYSIPSQTSFLTKIKNLKLMSWMTKLVLQYCVLLLCKK